MLSWGSKRSRHADAVVTGAGSGIGAAFAVELAARGGRVICSDVDPLGAQRTADAITDQGGAATAALCDVSRIDHLVDLAEHAYEWFEGPPTLLINNAGVGVGGEPIGDIDLRDWAWALGINLWGPINGCHVFAPLLREAGRGGIINVASAAAFGAMPGMGPYNVSKAAVLSLSETLAAELSGTGVAVTALCPTFVKTNIIENGRIAPHSAGVATQLMQWTGMSPQRVARLCLDTHDRGGLYCIPQPDARIVWATKRLLPATYTAAVGVLSRLPGPLSAPPPQRLDKPMLHQRPHRIADRRHQAAEESRKLISSRTPMVGAADCSTEPSSTVTELPQLSVAAALREHSSDGRSGVSPRPGSDPPPLST